MVAVGMDTNALMMPVECNIRVFDELDRLFGYDVADLIVPSAVSTNWIGFRRVTAPKRPPPAWEKILPLGVVWLKRTCRMLMTSLSNWPKTAGSSTSSQTTARSVIACYPAAFTSSVNGETDSGY